MRTFAYKFFQMKNLFHKLLAILTRFFAIFIKIPVLLLKCLFQKNFYLSFGIELNRIFEFPLKRNMLLLKYTTYFYEICICIKITTHIFVTTNQVLRKIQSAFCKYLDELKIKSCCSQLFCIKATLKTFEKFTRKRSGEYFFSKVTG